MTTLAQISTQLQPLLTTTTDAVAQEQAYVKRPDRAKFTPSTLVQTLVFGWWATPDATIEQLAQMAHRVGVEASPQAIDQRFTAKTAALLEAVLAASMQHVARTQPVAIPILQRFTSVLVHDSTTIPLPDALTTTWRGCGNDTAHGTAGLKCGVQIDLLTGALCGLDLTHGRTSDHALPIQHAIPAAGSLRLADLGFYDLEMLRELDQAGVFWLTRPQSNSRLRLPGHASQPLIDVLEGGGTDVAWDTAVLVGKEQPVAARLLARRVPQAVADERRRRLRAAAKEKGRAPARAAMALAAWNVVITNIPPERLTLEEALVLTRVRWQIELLFKLWKSHGRVDDWRTTNPVRILCEVYAKLLALVYQHWLIAACGWSDPERSLVKAAQLIRSSVVELARALASAAHLFTVLQTIERLLKRCAHLNKRRTNPTTVQRLYALTDGFAQA
ncbi:MAG: IS4 family transposase [Herpetosiphonaceae bacterium]|nr:IS4 family transposase [Herpetosiphonaceae bacterium]